MQTCSNVAFAQHVVIFAGACAYGVQEVIMAIPPAQPAEEKGPFFVREHLIVRC